MSGGDCDALTSFMETGLAHSGRDVIFEARIARVAELVDAYDSKSYGLWPCGFDSHPGYWEDFRLQRADRRLQMADLALY